MRKVIPFGNRVLVKRLKIGAKLGSGILEAPDTTKDRPTDLAEVVYVPDLTFVDETLLKDTNEIVCALDRKMRKDGDSNALIALLRLRDLIDNKKVAVGKKVFISKYVGTDFYTSEGESLTVVNVEDVIGIVEGEDE